MLGSDKNGVQRTLEEHEDVEAGEVAEQPLAFDIDHIDIKSY